MLCFGGTKNGLPVGEAVIFFNRALAEDFAYRVKQAGQLASKMRFISAPWLGLLENDTWLRNAGHANAMAQRLHTALSRRCRVSSLLRLRRPMQCSSTCRPRRPRPCGPKAGASTTSSPVAAVGMMSAWDTRESTIEEFVADFARNGLRAV